MRVLCFFLDGERDTAFKFKTEGEHGIYWVTQSNSSASATEDVTLVFAVKAGGYREQLIRKRDGVFVLQNVTNCPEEAPTKIAHF